jgi:hypothetical protein
VKLGQANLTNRVTIKHPALWVTVKRAAPGVTVKRPTLWVTVKRPAPDVTVKRPTLWVTVKRPAPDVTVKRPTLWVTVKRAAPGGRPASSRAAHRPRLHGLARAAGLASASTGSPRRARIS